MKTKLILSVLTLIVSFKCFAAPVECQLNYFSQRLFKPNSEVPPEIRDFSQTVNSVMKKTFDTADRLDAATLGLVSTIITGGTPLSELKPEQWGRFNISGNLIYQDMPFSGTALKGVKMTFSENSNSRTITTGSYGEFTESFAKLIPYTRLHLFPIPFVYTGRNSVPSIKVPITVKVESSVCNTETTIREFPIEPVVFILSKKE